MYDDEEDFVLVFPGQPSGSGLYPAVIIDIIDIGTTVTRAYPFYAKSDIIEPRYVDELKHNWIVLVLP